MSPRAAVELQEERECQGRAALKASGRHQGHSNAPRLVAYRQHVSCRAHAGVERVQGRGQELTFNNASTLTYLGTQAKQAQACLVANQVVPRASLW